MHIRVTVRDGRLGDLADIGIDCDAKDLIGDVLDRIGEEMSLPGVPAIDGRVPERTETVLESLLCNGSMVEFDGAATTGRLTGPRLKILSGPNAGQTIPLVPGRSVTFGRGSTVDVAMDDPTVSRTHLSVYWDGTRATVTDLKSRYGTFIAKDTAAGKPAKVTGTTPFGFGEQIQIGGSRIVLDRSRESRSRAGKDERGRIQVSRAPRQRPAPWQAPAVQLPRPREPFDQRPMPIWLPVIASAALGVVMALIFRQPWYLLIALCGPLVSLAMYMSSKRADRRRKDDDERRYRSDLSKALVQIQAAADDEDAFLHRRFPTPAAAAGVATENNELLWQRRRTDDDWLLVRLGTADRSTSVKVSQESPEPLPVLRSAPVGIRLDEWGALGIVGPHEDLHEVVRSVVVQCAAWHGPDELRIAVLAPGCTDLAWMRWLPHVDPGDGGPLSVAWHPADVDPLLEWLNTIVRQRRQQLGNSSLSEVLVVMAGAGALAVRSGFRTLLDEGPAVGIRFLCIDSAEQHLPGECRAVLNLVGDHGPTLRLDLGAAVQLSPDRLDMATAERVARGIAPLRLAGERSLGAIPSVVRYADLLDDNTDAETIRAGWRLAPANTAVQVGLDSAGPVEIDLVAHGPHGLVIGMTQAGKSEFLSTMLIGLALANTPERMNFLFVDYKGGATFKDLRRLPHVVGNVTNLSGAPARVLSSLDAELKRRQLLLEAADVTNLREYEDKAIVDRTLRPFPRLLVVVDEFSELDRLFPDAIDQFVSVARTGASLGVHLILATQPPARIDANIRANAALRVCLRVEHEYSMAVIDRPDAAAIGHHQRGRAFVKRGADLREVQTAWAGAPRVTSTVESRRVVRMRWDDVRIPEQASSGTDKVKTDLHALIDSVIEATRLEGLDALYRPWHDPLPAIVTLDELPVVRHQLVLGLRDQPAEQLQAPLSVPLGSGHVIVVGDAQTGRTSALIGMATGLARAHDPRELHLHVIDSGGRLSALGGLPHCGVVVDAEDSWRVDRLLARLTGLIRERRVLLAEQGVANLAELWATSPDAAPAHVVVLMDGAQLLEDYDRLEAFKHLQQNGPAAGVTLCVAGRETAIKPRLLNAFVHRICLKLPDDTHVSTLGLPTRTSTAGLPAGRGYWVADASEVQFPLLSSDSAGRAQQLALAGEVAKITARDAGVESGVLRIDSLPSRVSLAEALILPAQGGVLLGVSGDCLAGFTVDPAEHRLITVTGPRKSGRSTAVTALAAGLALAGRKVAMIRGRATPAHAAALEHGVELVPADGLLESLRAGADVVVIDDADLVTIPDGLVDEIRKPNKKVLLIGAVELDRLTGFGLSRLLRALSEARAGIILSPMSKATCLGVSVRPLPAQAGRGYLVLDGDATLGQVPDPVTA